MLKKRNKKHCFSIALLSWVKPEVIFTSLNSNLHSEIMMFMHCMPWPELQLWNAALTPCCGSANTAWAAAVTPWHSQAPARGHSWTRTRRFLSVCSFGYKMLSVPHSPPNPGSGSPIYGRRNNQVVFFISQWIHFFNYFHEWKGARRI